MTTVTSLAAEKREETGKGAARTLRRAGRIPAIIYGGGEGETKLSIEGREIGYHYLKANLLGKLVDLQVGEETIRVLTQAVQLHPVTDAIEHADFLRLNAESKVHVKVKVRFLNEDRCIGIKLGGLLNIVRRDIELVCSPDAIPEVIEIDILTLRIGESIHIDSITLPEGVTPVIRDRNFTIAAIAGRGGKKADAEGAEGA